jgi:hypothetical protein
MCILLNILEYYYDARAHERQTQAMLMSVYTQNYYITLDRNKDWLRWHYPRNVPRLIY